MSRENMVIRLNDRLVVFADENQWILSRAEGAAEAFKDPHQRRWRHLAFVGGYKSILLREIRRTGAAIDAEGSRALACLPGNFREWKVAQAQRATT